MLRVDDAVYGGPSGCLRRVTDCISDKNRHVRCFTVGGNSIFLRTLGAYYVGDATVSKRALELLHGCFHGSWQSIFRPL